MAEGYEPHKLNYSDFVITTHTLRESATIAANDSLGIINEAVTKEGGWYPLGISGFTYLGWATQYVFLFTESIRNQRVGAADIVLRLKNTLNQEITISGVSVDILWVRVN